jgi:hypothetical protein
VPLFGHLIESASLLLFAWVWIELRWQGRGEHLELVIAAVYGWLLEVLDMWIFGSYHYQPSTWLWLANVPVYIPLLWATIIHSSMALSDRAGLPPFARPFLDGLLAVLIDLAIDAVAIRLGLWSWQIPLHEGWFGVPAGNLCAWMWVAWWYGSLTRLVRSRLSRGEPRWHRWLVPVIAYAGLLTTLVLLGLAERWAGLMRQDQRLWVFAAHGVVFLAVVWYGRRTRGDRSPHKIPPSLFWNRWLMHGSFALVLLVSGLWSSVPALLGVSAGSMALEWWAHRWCEE